MHSTTPDAASSPEQLQRALERFDWLADQVRDQVHRADLDELGAVLDKKNARTSAKERALVMLGLYATARAEATLRWWDCAGEHPRVRLLHRLASRECARRRGRGCQARELAQRRQAA